MASRDEPAAGHPRRTVLRALPWIVAGLAAALLWLLLAPPDGSSAPAVRLVAVTVRPSSVEAGERIRVAGVIRNRAAATTRARIAVSLHRTRRSRRVRIARRPLSRVRARGRGRGRGRFRLAAAIPRRIAPARYYVSVCIRASGRASCRSSARRLAVVRAGAPRDRPQDGPRGTAYQTIDGFGTSARVFEDPHVFDLTGPAPPVTPEQRNAVLSALYRELGLTRVRPIQPDTTAGPPPDGIETENDNADPNATDLTRFDFSGRRLDLHAAQVARSRAQGATTAWISPLNRESWMGVTTDADAAEYAEWLLAQVRRFRQQGAPLDYISVANEPSYSRNPMSGEFVRDVIRNLGPRLEAEGLRVPFVVPDDVRSSSGAAVAATVLADPVARRYVGALATHLYDEPVTRVSSMRGLAARYGLPLWMTEFSLSAMGSAGRGSEPIDWAVLMHDLLARYDVAAIDYFWGFIGAGSGSSLISLHLANGTYTGFSRNKVYYYFGQFSRFVRPGATRVSAATSDDRIRVSAYYRGPDRVLVAVNPGDSPVRTRLSAADLAGVRAMSATRTSPTEDWAKLPATDVSGASISVTLPARSATTFTGEAAP